MPEAHSPTELPSPGPIKPVERIPDLDILRGIALFGILVVNLYLFSNPIAILAADSGLWTEWYNQAWLFVSRVFFEGKFITMFSFLFGLGFYIFTERLKVKELPARRTFIRRMGILFLLGMLHGWLFWAGDILAPYALSGLIILLFLYRTDKTIKVWIGLILGGFMLIYSLIILLVLWASTIPEVATEIEQGFGEAASEFQELLTRGYEVYATGTFAEMVAYRREEVSFAWTGMFFSPMGIPFIIAIFLLGFLIGRKGLIRQPNLLREILIPRRWTLLITGLLFSMLYALSHHFGSPYAFDSWMLLQILTIVPGAPLLMLGYCGFILKWLDEHRYTALLNRFSPVGRMALTNYLLQSVICTTIFYGYGIGLIGSFPPVLILPLALAIFAIQIAFSQWYFGKYKTGPLEKIWRIGTYLRKI